MDPTKKIILILGGGFGGIITARELDHILKKSGMVRSYQIVLVDKNAYHLYTPALYEVATTLKLDANAIALKEVVAIPFEKILQGKSVTFLRGEIQHVDVSTNTVTIEDHNKCQELQYAFLVLALGSEANYLNIPGLKEHSLVLKDLKDAIRLRDTIEHAFMNHEAIDVLIGGGGTTGVEIAGSLHGFLKRLSRIYAKPPIPTRIKIIEGSPTILSSFAPTVSRWAKNRLQALGIEIIADTLIHEVRQHTVTVKHAKTEQTRDLPFSVLIWTGGVKVNRLIENITVAKDAKNRCLINTHLEVGMGYKTPADQENQLAGPAESHPNIYAIGDNSCFYDPVRGKPIAGNAPHAIIQGKIAARNISAEILETKKTVFKPKTPPFIIPIGGKYAIADLGFIRFHGIGAWILKQFVEPNYYRRILSLKNVLPLWIKGLRLFLKND